MHDKAPCHNSNSTKRYLADRGIAVLVLPGKSPDLNPIEKVWDIMKKEIGQLPNNKQKLWSYVCNVWYSIPRKIIMELYDSMPRKVQAFFAAEGGETQY